MVMGFSIKDNVVLRQFWKETRTFKLKKNVFSTKNEMRRFSEHLRIYYNCFVIKEKLNGKLYGFDYVIV